MDQQRDELHWAILVNRWVSGGFTQHDRVGQEPECDLLMDVAPLGLDCLGCAGRGDGAIRPAQLDKEPGGCMQHVPDR